MLLKYGKDEAVACFKIGGRYSLKLAENIQLICALFEQRLLNRWAVFDTGDLSFEPFFDDVNDGLVAGGDTKAEPESVKIFRVDRYKRNDGYDFLIKIGDGPYVHVGADYAALEACMMKVVYPCELVQRGIFKQLIPEFFETIKTAPPLPDDALITIAMPVAADKWRMNEYLKIQNALPPKCVREDGLISVTYGQLREAGRGGLFCMQPVSYLNYIDTLENVGGYVTWHVNESSSDRLYRSASFIVNKNGDMRVLGAINIFEIVTTYGANKGKTLVNAILEQIKALDENISILERQDLPDQVNID